MSLTTLSPEQIMQRAQGIGASEVAAILGRSPFAGAAQVYERKINPHNEQPPASEDQERGIFLEAGMRDWYRHRTGMYVTETGTLPIAGSDIVMASPDGVAYHADGTCNGVEFKCPRYSFHWRESDDDEDDDAPRKPVTYVVPDYYQIQALLQAEALDADYVDVAAFLDGGLKIIPVKRDRRTAAKIIAACEAFWKHHVVPRIPPPPDDSQKYADWLREKFPRNSCAEYIDAPPEAQEWVDQYCDAKDVIAIANKQKLEARNHLIPMIGEHSGMMHASGKIHFKTTSPKSSTDWEAVARVCKATQEMIDQHTTSKPGSRRFDVRRKLSKESK